MQKRKILSVLLTFVLAIAFLPTTKIASYAATAGIGTSGISEFSDPDVASVTVGTTTSNYQNFDDAFDAWKDAQGTATLTLLDNCRGTAPETYQLQTSGNHILDLNGKTLTLATSIDAFVYELTIQDSASGGVLMINTTNTYAIEVGKGGPKTGTLTIAGGKITTSSSNLNGVMVNGICKMSGGEVTGFKDGVTVSANADSFQVSGTAKVSGNNRNVYLGTGKKITISGPMSTGAEIKVTTEEEPVKDHDVIFATKDGNVDIYQSKDFFVSDYADKYFTIVEGPNLKFSVDRPLPTHKHDEGTPGAGVDFNPWIATDSMPTAAGNYYLTVDVNQSSTWTLPEGTVNLCLAGHDVSMGHAVVGNGSTLNIYACEAGGFKPAANAANAFEVSGGTVNMYGGTITGFSTSGNGGGVSITSGGTFNMYGGSISNNTASDGGGVFVGSDAGGFTVSGNVNITGNKSGNADNNVSINPSSKKISVVSALSDIARIGLSVKESGVFTSGLSGKGSISNFSADNNQFILSLTDGGEAQLDQAGISLDKDKLTLKIDEEQQLAATTIPSAAEVTWISSAEGTVTVDATGKVKAKAPGDAVITAKITVAGQDYTASCTVTVLPSITIDPTSLAMIPEQEKTITASTIPSGATVIWTSSDESTARVDTTGKVTALKEGTATITASVDGAAIPVTAQCAVTIGTTPSVRPNKDTLDLRIGEEETLTATTIPETAAVTWTSSNPEVATVSESGTVKAIGTGNATITAKITVEGIDFQGTCAVNVTPQPVTPSVSVSPSSLVLQVGTERQIEVTTVPAGARVTFTSSNPAAASVSENGVIASNSEGDAIITASITVDNVEYSATCMVSVRYEPVTPTVKLYPPALTITMGNSRRLEVTTVPANVPVTFASTNTEVASVDSNGLITANQEGEAIITGTILVNNIMYIGTCSVTVDSGGGQAQTVVVPQELTEASLSPGIRNRYGTVQQVVLKLEESVGLAPGTQNRVVYDAQVLIIENGHLRPATTADIPPEGLEATFSYPDGTSMLGNRFDGAHMIGDASGGYQAGDIEHLQFVPGPDGLFTRMHGLSPVIITWSTVTPSEPDEIDRHVHVYEWDTIQATADQDGEMRYQCRICGDIQTRVPITAYYVFNKETTERIRKAKQGETVKIETARWISFHKMVMQALSERPDVTLEVSFLDEGHKGTRKTFTIPAGTDVMSLVDDKGFAGFIFLTNKFGN